MNLGKENFHGSESLKTYSECGKSKEHDEKIEKITNEHVSVHVGTQSTSGIQKL